MVHGRAGTEGGLMDYNATFDMDANVRPGAFADRPARPEPPLPAVGDRVSVLYATFNKIAPREATVVKHVPGFRFSCVGDEPVTAHLRIEFDDGREVTVHRSSVRAVA